MRVEDHLHKIDAYKQILQNFDLNTILSSAADTGSKLYQVRWQQEQLQQIKQEIEADMLSVHHTYQITDDTRLASVLNRTLADYDLIKTCAANILLQLEMMQRQLKQH
jgi:hypothetical protein